MKYDVVAFYVTAHHQDDWQLFRGHHAHEDLLTPGAKIVFVYSTANDAGLLPGWWGRRGN